MFPWMLCKIELCTQPRVSVHKENCLSPASSWSTSTTVGLNTKILISKFLLLKGTKHAIWSLFSFLFSFLLCFFSGNIEWIKAPETSRKKCVKLGCYIYGVVGKLEKWNIRKWVIAIGLVLFGFFWNRG